MKLKLFKFDEGRAEKDRRLFSAAIEDDPLVFFHGTSGFNAEAVESEGFHGRLPPHEQMEQVIEIFNRMRWVGDNADGLGVLQNYTLRHDRVLDGKKLVFFAVRSLTALSYATRDFAGGETLFALRNAFHDLESYLADPVVREQHEAHMAKEYEWLKRSNTPPSALEKAKPARVDLGWLEAQLRSTLPIRELAQESYRKHDRGVVYAVRLTLEEFRKLERTSAAAVELDGCVPASRIIARMDVPGDLSWRKAAHLGMIRIGT